MARRIDFGALKKCLVMLAIVIAFFGGTTEAGKICGIEAHKLSLCIPAVTGVSPPPPSNLCCAIIHYANLPCLCSFKSLFAAMKIDPENAFALPGKCGLIIPPECHV